MVDSHLTANLGIVEKATVRLTIKGGQGVLVPGGLIVTAAHCVNWSIEGGMVLGDYYIEEIETCTHDKLKTAPMAIEPVSDIAVLGSLDNQKFYDDAIRFEEFCEETEPVRLCTVERELFEKFPCYIRSHKGKFINGTAMQCRAGCEGLAVTVGEQVEGGTSGGPVVNENGELLGIVSHFNECRRPEDDCTGAVPRPHLALPVWICSMILGKDD
jgi:hypothetical protein